MAVTAEATMRRPRSVDGLLASGNLGNRSSRQMKSQHDLPSRNDLQSCWVGGV